MWTSRKTFPRYVALARDCNWRTHVRVRRARTGDRAATSTPSLWAMACASKAASGQAYWASKPAILWASALRSESARAASSVAHASSRSSAHSATSVEKSLGPRALRNALKAAASTSSFGSDDVIAVFQSSRQSSRQPCRAKPCLRSRSSSQGLARHTFRAMARIFSSSNKSVQS